MASEWRDRKWGDIATLEYGRGLSGYGQSHGGFTVFGTNGPIGRNARALCTHPTVVIGRKGAYRGVHYSPEPCFVIDTAFYLEPKVDLYMRWAYYQLLTLNINSMDSGSAIPSTSRGDFYALPVKFPPLPVQQAIAHVLGALDDKIELNRKMNETLEQMAKAIFKSWFMDFEPFRSKGMVDSPLGKIPKGWNIQTVGDLAERVAMGPFGSSIKVDTFVPEGIPVISGQHLWGIMLDDSANNFVTLEHADGLANANVFRGDVIFTHAGSIGQVAWIPEDSVYERYVISQRQFYMRCVPAKVSPSYVVYYFSSPEGRHKLLANTSSSGVPSIARPVTYLRSIKMPIPPRQVLSEFDNAVRPMHRQMRSQVSQSRTLAGIRDALLPKLMSGEVRTKEVEKGAV